MDRTKWKIEIQNYSGNFRSSEKTEKKQYLVSTLKLMDTMLDIISPCGTG